MIPPSPRAGAHHGEHRVRFGNYEARKRDSGRSNLRDPYRVIVTLNWSQFVLVLLAIELLLNLVFALLYLARPGAVANAHPGSLADAFFFSIETLATVGYGEMFPADLYGHVVAAVEIVTGLAFGAVATGLIFVRVSRPKPCFRYAENLVIAPYRGKRALMIRVASDRLGALYDAEARLSVLVPDTTEEGHHAHAIVNLPLVRASTPVLALDWTLMHVIEEASLLYGLDQAGMIALGLRLFVMLRAEDATLSATVRDLRAFDPSQIRIGMQYDDALYVSGDGYPVLELDRLGALKPETPPRTGA